MRDESELVELIPDDYREHHLALARSVARLLDGEELDDAAAETLVAATGRSLDAIGAALHVAEVNESPDVGDVSGDADDETPESDGEGVGKEDVNAPSIICTSLIGSKGLSAGHVFIVGFNDGHLPRDFRAISDDEVCQFLVGLSRTRKVCHVISVRNYGGNWLEPSAFAEWIEPHLEPLKADKKHLEAS